jgi:hypothetical protein
VGQKDAENLGVVVAADEVEDVREEADAGPGEAWRRPRGGHYLHLGWITESKEASTEPKVADKEQIYTPPHSLENVCYQHPIRETCPTSHNMRATKRVKRTGGAEWLMSGVWGGTQSGAWQWRRVIAGDYEG